MRKGEWFCCEVMRPRGLHEVFSVTLLLCNIWWQSTSALHDHSLRGLHYLTSIYF